jgi:low molecular weight phosphotyrosine protein phosphatase
MDRSNLSDIQRLSRSKLGAKAKVMLWGEYAVSGGPSAGSDSAGGKGTKGKKGAAGPEIVEDPYYGGKEGFALAYEQCSRFTRHFLEDVFPGVKGPWAEE